MSPSVPDVHHRSEEKVLHLISSTGLALTLAPVEEASGSSANPVAALECLVVGFVAHHAGNHTGARVVNRSTSARRR